MANHLESPGHLSLIHLITKGVRWPDGGVLKYMATSSYHQLGVSIVMGVPKNGRFIEKIPLKWMIWGYPYFRKPPIFAWDFPWNIMKSTIHCWVFHSWGTPQIPPVPRVLIVLHRGFELLPLLAHLLGQVRHGACSTCSTWRGARPSGNIPYTKSFKLFSLWKLTYYFNDFNEYQMY